MIAGFLKHKTLCFGYRVHTHTHAHSPISASHAETHLSECQDTMSKQLWHVIHGCSSKVGAPFQFKSQNSNSICFFLSYIYSCLFVWLFVCLFVWLFVCLVVCLFVCLFVWLFVCLFACLLGFCLLFCFVLFRFFAFLCFFF